MAKYEIDGNYTRVRMKLEELQVRIIKDVSNLAYEEKVKYFRELDMLVVRLSMDLTIFEDKE
jgi:hypothetical protein